MSAHGTTFADHVAHWVAHLAHVLPAQAPIRDFVHHNTLHGFQHLPFPDALAAAQALTGARPYWPEQRFREAHAAGRITDADLDAALCEAGIADLDQPVVGGLARRQILLASLKAWSPAPPSRHLAWLKQETGLAEAPVFAHFARLTVGEPATDWLEVAQARCRALFDDPAGAPSLRSVLHALTGVDVLERVRQTLQRHLAAHLDLGLAAWRNPAREAGFYAAWRASAGMDLRWELDEQHTLREEILHLPDDPLVLLSEELARVLPDPAQAYSYLARLALELPGWSGMFLWRADHPGRGDATPVAMVDYLAVRLLLERLICEDLTRHLVGYPMGLADLAAYFNAHLAECHVRLMHARGEGGEAWLAEAAAAMAGDADDALWQRLAASAQLPLADPEGRAWQLTQCWGALGDAAPDVSTLTPAMADALYRTADSLSALQRGECWLLAYEHHYREHVFAALAANRKRSPAAPETACSAQVVLCMDDREEGTRRHLEEVAPDIQTFGAAGFFGVPMYWQGLDDAAPTALCPVVVTPQHQVNEVAAASVPPARRAAHVRRRTARLRWRERLYQATRLQPLAGSLLANLAAVPALFGLAAGLFAPAGSGELKRRWREAWDGKLDTRLALDASAPAAAGVQAGFTLAEQVDRVAAFLRTIGLTSAFAPLVLMLGHGSHSQNNPHASAYDCGACSGRHGGPNARAFAQMANQPAVRAGLAARGIHIPESCWFVAAQHDTCDDSITWYDLAQVPAVWQAALDRLVAQLAEACRAHAVERCRRLASAPPRPTPWRALRHVQGRAEDLSQARPELGHATNAAAFIGRRSMSRGLFLDRRVFLISYDPTQDEDGRIVENILLAAGPVGAGISLEYYFSTVDNARFGCGSKVTHNLTGAFGVMDGGESDLRTGLPLQMVEIHEPMRLLVVVEQQTARLTEILARQPALQELVGNAWIILAAQDPSTGGLARYCPRRGWLPWSGRAVLPQVARSRDWFAGESGLLPPALLLRAHP